MKTTRFLHLRVEIQRMVEAMEAAGLVGELQASGTREVLVPIPGDS